MEIDVSIWLPAGVELGDPFGQLLPHGWRAYSAIDSRSGQSVRRLVRWIPLGNDDEAEWLGKWNERWAALVNSTRPELALLAPLETHHIHGPSAHGILLIERTCSNTLAEHITTKGVSLSDFAVASTLLQQLAKQLQEWHSTGFAHGDLCLEDVCLDRASLKDCQRAWWSGLLTGHICSASNGRLCRNGTAFESTNADPKKQQALDIKAFLEVAASAYLGRHAVQAPEGDAKWASRIQTQLRLRGDSPTWLYCALDSLAKSRPLTADELVALFDRRRFSRKVLFQATPLLAFLVLAVVIVWRYRANHSDALKTIAETRQELQNESQNLKQTTSDLDNERQQMQRLRDQVTRANDDLEDARRQIKQLAFVSPISDDRGTREPPSALEFWKKHREQWPIVDLAGLPDYDKISQGSRATIENWQTQLRDLREPQDGKLHAEIKNVLKDFENKFRFEPNDELVTHAARRVWSMSVEKVKSWDECRGEISQVIGSFGTKNQVRKRLEAILAILNAAKQPAFGESKDVAFEKWKDVDEITRRSLAVGREPWNESKRQELKLYFDSYDKAYNEWKRCSKVSRTAEEFTKNVERCAKDLDGNASFPYSNGLLIHWDKEIAVRDKWDIELVDGKSTGGYGKFRRIGFSPYAAGDFHDEDWANEAGRGSLAPRPIRLCWKIGEPIEVLVDTERTTLRLGARPRLLKKTTGGPIALWSLFHEQGGIIADDDTMLMFGSSEFLKMFPRPHDPKAAALPAK